MNVSSLTWKLAGLLVSAFIGLAEISAAHAAGYTIANAQIIGPTGTVFYPRGINILGSQLNKVVGNASAQPLTTLFPKINFIRVDIADYSNVGNLSAIPSVASIEQSVNWATSQGIVVELEYHAYTSTLSSSALSGVTAWYSTAAATFKGNPNVWFGTQNEPNSPSATQVSDEMSGIYNAIRNAGNSAPVMLCPWGGGNGTQYMNQATIAAMNNVIWDLHFYNWVSKYSTDQNANNQALQNEMATFRKFVNLPVIIGEYGNSTSGTGVDAGGTQTVAAVQNPSNGQNGSVAWGWAPGGNGDDLLNSPYSVDGSTGLSSYGLLVASYIKAASGGTAASPAPVTNPTPAPTPVAQPPTTPVSSPIPPPNSSTNLITNPSFENGLNGYKYFRKVQISSDANSGKYSASISCAQAAVYQVVQGLKPNTNYVFSAELKTTAGAASIGVMNYGGKQLMIPSTLHGYQALSTAFKTGSTDTSALVFCYVSNGSSSCDDLSLKMAP